MCLVIPAHMRWLAINELGQIICDHPTTGLCAQSKCKTIITFAFPAAFSVFVLKVGSLGVAIPVLTPVTLGVISILLMELKSAVVTRDDRPSSSNLSSAAALNPRLPAGQTWKKCAQTFLPGSCAPPDLPALLALKYQQRRWDGCSGVGRVSHVRVGLVSKGEHQQGM